MMNCQNCQNWQLKQAGQMAKHGYAACTLGKPYEFLSAQHACPQHRAATDEVAQARAVWLAKR